MYRFFVTRASYSFYALLGVVSATLVACSSTPELATVPIEAAKLEREGCAPLTPRPSSSMVYRCGTPQGDVFMTSLKDCGASEKLSFQATTRQLLVGLVGVKMLSQESVDLRDIKALQSVVLGTVDADPVVMSTFTYRQNGCITDLIVWKGVATDQTDDQIVATFGDLSKHIAVDVVRDGIPSEEPARAQQ